MGISTAASAGGPLDQAPVRPRPRGPERLALVRLNQYICMYVCDDRGTDGPMANVVTINRPDVVALIEQAARKLTRGNKTEAIALALRRLLDEDARAGSLFGAHHGSVKVRDGVDLVAPILDVEPDAQTGQEVER